jgi:hypothetical protein
MCMQTQTQDFISTSGHLQVHLSLSEYNTSYIFVNDIFNDRLIMRYFNNHDSAVDWIKSFKEDYQ